MRRGFNLYSLMRNDVEHRFMYLSAIWIPFVKCLFRSFAPPLPSSFKNQIVFIIIVVNL